MKKFKGVMPALVTPLNADETINVEVLRQLTGNLLSRGADGFYIGGATGEGIVLKAEQRMILAEEGVKCCKGKQCPDYRIVSVDDYHNATDAGCNRACQKGDV